MAAVLALSLAGCAAAVPPPRMAGGGAPLRVAGFQHWQGAEARRAADARCGARGVAVSVYDRYDRATGEWVYPGGCA